MWNSQVAVCLTTHGSPCLSGVAMMIRICRRNNVSPHFFRKDRTPVHYETKHCTIRQAVFWLNSGSKQHDYVGLYGVVWGYMGLYEVIWNVMGLCWVIYGYIRLVFRVRPSLPNEDFIAHLTKYGLQQVLTTAEHASVYTLLYSQNI